MADLVRKDSQFVQAVREEIIDRAGNTVWNPPQLQKMTSKDFAAIPAAPSAAFIHIEEKLPSEHNEQPPTHAYDIPKNVHAGEEFPAEVEWKVQRGNADMHAPRRGPSSELQEELEEKAKVWRDEL